MSIEQQIQKEFMKQDYEGSRSTLGAIPILAAPIRAQSFLLNPAKGRSHQQLTEDYQKLAARAGTYTTQMKYLQSAYVVNWARTDPARAMAWARDNIHDFKSDATTRNRFFNFWHNTETADATRWLNNNPDKDVTILSRSVIKKGRSVLHFEPDPSLITLPR